MSLFNIELEETIAYEKLFSQCDLQKNGKVSGLDAYKLFLKSGLSIDDLKKVCEYCGANRLGFFGRSQFYIALKIISLAQAGNRVDDDILHKNVISSLPLFEHEVSDEAFKTVQTSSELPLSIPPPPNKHHMRTLSGNNILHNVPLSNRYSYSSPVSKAMTLGMSRGSWDHFSPKNDNCNLKDHDSADKDDEVDEEDSVWDGYTEEDNKGLLDPDIKTDFNLFYHTNNDGDDNEYSSSSDHDSSSFSYESDENYPNADVDFQDNNATGYTLMEAVEGLATAPELENSHNVMPMATNEQLDYYTKCFQTIQTTDNVKVAGCDAINFFQVHNLEEKSLKKILHLTNITPDSQITLIEFSRALHLITHYKSGFSIPDILPEHLLPVEFEQPDEPFSIDLSDGELPEVSNNFPLSSLESSYSADGDNSNFDFPDVCVNRDWSKMKAQFMRNQKKTSSLNIKILPKKPEKKLSMCIPPQNEEIAPVIRPRPCARKSLSSIVPLATPSSVAPPPPPRSSVLSDQMVKKLSFEKAADPCGDSFSTSTSDSIPKDVDNDYRKISESSKSEITSNTRHSSNQEARKQLQTNMRELKSKNHVLLRLNNEMTSELEELHEQRVNLDLQLEYIKQSQIDIQ